MNGAAELITDGVNGFVIDDPHQIDRITEAIAAVCDRGKASEMGRAAFATAQEYSIAGTAESTLRIFETLPSHGYSHVEPVR